MSNNGDTNSNGNPPPAPTPSSSTQASRTPVSSVASHIQYAPYNPSNLRESERPPPTPATDQIGAHDYFTDEPQDYQDNPRNEFADQLRKRSVRDPDFNWDDESIHSDHDTLAQNDPRVGDSGPSAPSSTFPYSRSHNHIDASSTDVSSDAGHKFFGDIMKRNTTKLLAKRHGLRHASLMYLYYYIPLFNWVGQYRWHHLPGDLTASVTMASFYIPMALSLASNLAHVPAINGLYAFAINPVIYAIFGSCPQLIVGPEAAGSLLLGNVVRDNINRGHASDEDDEVLSRICGVVTGVSGAFLLIAGLARIGFLDNVLSRPFLRGFISAIGIVVFIDQFITELGLLEVAQEIGGIVHGSSVIKIIFIVEHIKEAHPLTCAISFGSFAIIMICREVKRRLQPRYPVAAYIPDRCIVVITATILSWKLDWASKGVAILGKVTSGDLPPFSTHWPFDFAKIKHAETALSTSFVIALLGFFESSVAARSLGPAPAGGTQNIQRSPNRELVALGLANVVGGVFMSLPAFGGYGRSKVNASTGGKTPMSNIFLSLITIFCIFVLLPAFRYIPRGVLSAMISVVGWSLMEEAPPDLRFFWKIRGYTELLLIAIVSISTFFYSLEVGIALGIGFSLLRVIKHATRPRIQILGRARDGQDQFENAEADPDRFEFIEDCLIVKIPEPLTFANTGDLEKRLTRLAEYESSATHPAYPRIRSVHQHKNIIFDIHGVTGLDAAGAQVLSDLLQSYKEKGVRIFFCRVPNPRSKVYRMFESSGIVEKCGGPRHFVGSVKEAIRMSQLESLSDEFRDEPDLA